MKYHQPRTIAFINAIIITLAYLLLAVVSALVFHPPVGHFLLALYTLGSSALIFLFCYLVFRYTLEKFIYSKIRLIYKSIHSIKARKQGNGKQDPNILQNVTAEVESWENEKRREIEQLQQLERYRKDFLGNVSHELKTPVFSIQGYILTLLDGGLEDPSINREYLRRAGTNVDRLIRIIEDLDEISQLDSGELALKVTRFDIVQLVREVVDSLEIKISKHEAIVNLANEGRPLLVAGDREKIRQVVINLLDNAIRYRSSDPPKIKVSFFDMDENILVEVTDNGIGIEEGEIPRVFERFYRTVRGRESSRKGKGLGLAIVKHILEAHEQSVHVRSTVGIGSTFGFTLKKGD
jgi:two-component system, OmpR family, phosphate regulon sensor histidine kinase PhoR